MKSTGNQKFDGLFISRSIFLVWDKGSGALSQNKQKNKGYTGQRISLFRLCMNTKGGWEKVS